MVRVGEDRIREKMIGQVVEIGESSLHFTHHRPVIDRIGRQQDLCYNQNAIWHTGEDGSSAANCVVSVKNQIGGILDEQSNKRKRIA